MIIAAFILSALCVGALLGHFWTAHVDRKVIARRDAVIRYQSAQIGEAVRAGLAPKPLAVEDPPFTLSIVNTTGGAIRVRAAFEPAIKAGTPTSEVSPAQRTGVALLEYLDEIMSASGAEGAEAVIS